MHACYASMDPVVKFQYSNESIVYWKGGSSIPRGLFISNLKARKIIAKG